MRLRNPAALVIAVLVWASTSCASPDVTTIEAFVTRDGRLVAEPAQIPAGETIIEIQNDQPSRQRMVLVRTDRASRLPVIGGVVPMGGEADVEFEGDGYTLITKLETMRAFFSGDAIVSRIHEYLEAGTYELFSNLRGHYEAGKRVVISVASA